MKSFTSSTEIITWAEKIIDEFAIDLNALLDKMSNLSDKIITRELNILDVDLDTDNPRINSQTMYDTLKLLQQGIDTAYANISQGVITLQDTKSNTVASKNINTLKRLKSLNRSKNFFYVRRSGNNFIKRSRMYR